MIIFSHRGLGMGIPENTIKTFRAALEQGFSLELDVQSCKDNSLIILHDSDFNRTLGVDKKVNQITIKDIKKVRNTASPISEFEDVCLLLKEVAKPDQLLAIHIKDEHQPKIIKNIAKILTKHKIINQAFIFDLTKRGADELRSYNKKIRNAFSISEKRYFETIYLLEDVKDDPNLDIIWWDEWGSGLYSKENFDKVKRVNKPIFAISPELHLTHNHPYSRKGYENVWKNLITWGIDGICTDFPLQLRDMVKRWTIS